MLVDCNGRPVPVSKPEPGIGAFYMRLAKEELAAQFQFRSKIVDVRGDPYPNGLKIGHVLNVKRPARFGGVNG